MCPLALGLHVLGVAQPRAPLLWLHVIQTRTWHLRLQITQQLD